MLCARFPPSHQRQTTPLNDIEQKSVDTGLSHCLPLPASDADALTIRAEPPVLDADWTWTAARGWVQPTVIERSNLLSISKILG
jgi:hypothetical protein